MSDKDMELKTEEVIEVEETTEENVPTPEENDLEESPEEELDGDQLNNTEEDESEEQDEVIDYKAELEKERRLKENYKQATLKKDRQLKELKEQTSLDDEGVVEQVLEKVKEELGSFQSAFVEDTISEIADSISANDDEKALILHHYENTIQRSGVTKDAIRRDLDLSKILANKDKILKKQKALEHAARVRQTTPATPNFPSQKMKQTKPSNLSPEMKRFYDAMDKVIAKSKKTY